MRWMVRGGAVLALLVLALGLAVWLIPADRVARLAERQVQTATGRALEVQGPVKASLWPGIAVETGPVRLANADWADPSPMIEAEGLRISLDWAALIGGEIRIAGLDLQAPRLRLERHQDGRANWDLVQSGATSADPGGETPASGFSLAEARMRDGEIRFVDRATGVERRLSGIDARLRLPEGAGPADLAVTGRINAQAVALDLTASPASALISGAMATGRIRLTSGGSEADFQGSFGHAPLAADGALHLDLGDRIGLARLLGVEIPDLPTGLGARVARLDGRAVLSPDLRLVLHDALVVLDDTRLQLGADIQPTGGTPRIRAAVAAETPLVVAIGTDKAPQAGQSGTEGWSSAPIDLSGLRAADADVSFSAPATAVGPVRTGALRGRMVLEDGRATVTLSELAAYEGQVTGTLVLNAAGRGTARAELRAEAIALQPLLRDLTGTDRLISRLDGQVSLLSTTASVAEMMHRLQGDGQVRLGKGELRGLDLLGMLRTLDPGHIGEGQRTIFDAVSTRFSIADGVLRADDLALSAPYLRVAGAGTVGIGTRTLDYRLTPVALQNADGTGGLAVPLKITGPWAAPRYQLDMAALAHPKLDAERARAERKLAERLGADAETGETLEDAAKRKLETELRRGLGKLFGN